MMLPHLTLRIPRGLRSRLRTLGLVAALGLSACTPPPPAAAEHGPGLVILTDEPKAHPRYFDFGKVRYGERVEHTYVLHNGDEQPVSVLSIQTACNCTQVRRVVVHTPDGRRIEGEPERRPEIVSIPPGAELHLTFVIDTGVLLVPNADKLTIVRMRTDSENSPFVDFEMKVTTQKLFQVSPPEVRMDEVPVNHGQDEVVRILRGDPSYVANVLSVKAPGKFVDAELTKAFHFEDPIWSLHLRVHPGEQTGPFFDQVVLLTSDDEGREGVDHQRELPIPIRGHFVEDIRLYPASLAFGPIPSDESGTIDAFLKALVPGARIGIEAAEVLGPWAEHVTVVCHPRAPDSQGRSPIWDVILTTDGQLPPGAFEGRLRLSLDDSGYPTIERAFQGEVLSD